MISNLNLYQTLEKKIIFDQEFIKMAHIKICGYLVLERKIPIIKEKDNLITIKTMKYKAYARRVLQDFKNRPKDQVVLHQLMDLYYKIEAETKEKSNFKAVSSIDIDELLEVDKILKLGDICE